MPSPLHIHENTATAAPIANLNPQMLFLSQAKTSHAVGTY